MTEWFKRIDTVTNSFLKEFGDLNTDQLNRKPGNDRWSIAQNLSHIILLNTSYFTVIEDVKNGNYRSPFTGKIGFLVRTFGKIINKAAQPDNPRRMKTFKLWEPPDDTINENILEKFNEHQGELKSIINGSQHLLDKGTVISSPVNKYIVLTIDTAFEILVTHEERHLEQARRIHQDLANTTLSQ